MKACVIGLGQVGLPTARYIANKDLVVWGYDIREQTIARVKGPGLNVTTDWSKVPDQDVYIVCVGTLLKEKEPDLTSVFDVCKKIANVAGVSSLVSIESTVVPGTCRKIHENVFKKRVALVHVPHRYWRGNSIKYGVNQMRVIGAIDDKSLKKGVNFYRDCLGIPVYIAPSLETAEMSKVVENAYRYLQIAFAEELKMMCKEGGLNFEDVRRACNTKWNVEILEAREGILGSCLPKDTRYLIWLSKYNTLLKAAVDTDEVYKRFVVKSQKNW